MDPIVSPQGLPGGALQGPGTGLRTEAEAPAGARLVLLQRARETAERVADAAAEVHRAVGPGLAVAFYGRALALELHARGVAFRRDAAIDVRFRGSSLGRVWSDFLFEEGVAQLQLERVRGRDLRRARSIAMAADRRWALALGFGADRLEILRWRASDPAGRGNGSTLE